MHLISVQDTAELSPGPFRSPRSTRGLGQPVSLSEAASRPELPLSEAASRPELPRLLQVEERHPCRRMGACLNLVLFAGRWGP